MEIVSITAYLDQKKPRQLRTLLKGCSDEAELRRDNWVPYINSKGDSLETLSEWGVTKSTRSRHFTIIREKAHDN